MIAISRPGIIRKHGAYRTVVDAGPCRKNADWAPGFTALLKVVYRRRRYGSGHIERLAMPADCQATLVTTSAFCRWQQRHIHCWSGE